MTTQNETTPTAPGTAPGTTDLQTEWIARLRQERKANELRKKAEAEEAARQRAIREADSRRRGAEWAQTKATLNQLDCLDILAKPLEKADRRIFVGRIDPEADPAAFVEGALEAFEAVRKEVFAD